MLTLVYEVGYKESEEDNCGKQWEKYLKWGIT
jgi:hypothetical protein